MTQPDICRVFYSEINGFVVLHKNSDVVLVTVRHRCDHMENFMGKVADKLHMDYN